MVSQSATPELSSNTSRHKRWIAVFDNHGDMQDDSAVELMFDFMKGWKPDYRIHGGDCFDVRRWRLKASDVERRESMNDDVECGLQFLARFQPTHFLRGNHDERIWDRSKSDDAEQSDYAKVILQKIDKVLPRGCVMFPYDKRRGVCDIGKLRVIHGYSSGVHAAKIAAQVYGACLMGHVHYIDHASVPGLQLDIGRACGCLCQLDQEYNRAQIQTLRQQHGFAYGVIDDNGFYQMFQAHPVGDTWYLPTEFNAASQQTYRELIARRDLNEKALLN